MALSKHGVAQTAAAKITRRNPDKYADKFVEWIDSKTHQTAAMDALNAASDLSKHPRIILALAEQFYQTLDDYPEESALPEGGSPGQVLGVTAGGKGWVDLSSSPFRGEWAQDELVYSQGFSDGITAPFTAFQTGLAAAPAVSAVSPGAPWTTSVQLAAIKTYPDNRSVIELDVSQLGISGITRMTCKTHMNSEYYNRGAVYKNGTRLNDLRAHAWTDREFTVDADDVIQWSGEGRTTLTNAGTGGNNFYVTAIQFYAASDPYMIGQFVTHQGKMWKSIVDNNPAVPGVDGSWVETLELPGPSGTTAERPDPALASPGFQYFDTTLGHPVWSNGTAWVNATGTTV